MTPDVQRETRPRAGGTLSGTFLMAAGTTVAKASWLMAEDLVERTDRGECS